jgi:hypothetical protein
MFRRSIVAAVAAAAFAAPAAADGPVAVAAATPMGGYNYTPVVAGYLGLSGGGIFTSGTGLGIANLDGALTLPMGGLNIELETRGYVIFASPDPFLLGAGIIHTYWRSPNIAIGPFGGPEYLAVGTAAIGWHLGAEAQFYLNAVTFYLQSAIVTSAGSPAAWYARAALRVFPAENVRLEAGLRYLNSGGTAIWTALGEVEYQLHNSPLSALTTVRYTGQGGTSAIAALFGFRFNTGGGRLSDQVAPMNTLPLVY